MALPQLRPDGAPGAGGAIAPDHQRRQPEETEQECVMSDDIPRTFNISLPRQLRERVEQERDREEQAEGYRLSRSRFLAKLIREALEHRDTLR